MEKLLLEQHLTLGKNQSIAICCLWSDKSMIESALAANDYCVLGNLYSAHGINFLVRNLLCETKIRFLILTGHDRNKTGYAVRQLFEQGLDEKNFIQGSQIQLDQNITPNDIAFLTLRVKLIDLINQSGKLRETLAELKSVPLDDRFIPARNIPLPILREIPYISNDSNGFFTIRIEDCRQVCHGKTCFSCVKPILGMKEIVIEHYHADGTRSDFFMRGNQFEKVWLELENSHLISSSEHRAYLERELEKAFQALESNTDYKQPFVDLHN